MVFLFPFKRQGNVVYFMYLAATQTQHIFHILIDAVNFFISVDDLQLFTINDFYYSFIPLQGNFCFQSTFKMSKSSNFLYHFAGFVIHTNSLIQARKIIHHNLDLSLGDFPFGLAKVFQLFNSILHLVGTIQSSECFSHIDESITGLSGAITFCISIAIA